MFECTVLMHVPLPFLVAAAVHFATTQDPLPDFDLTAALRAVPADLAAAAAAAAAAYPLLGVLAPGLPAPLEVLQRLWQLESTDAAKAVGARRPGPCRMEADVGTAPNCTFVPRHQAAAAMAQMLPRMLQRYAPRSVSMP